jgi:hypothetical protein
LPTEDEIKVRPRLYQFEAQNVSWWVLAKQLQNVNEEFRQRNLSLSAAPTCIHRKAYGFFGIPCPEHRSGLRDALTEADLFNPVSDEPE